jgi:hypothetical protein
MEQLADSIGSMTILLSEVTLRTLQTIRNTRPRAGS